MPATNAPRSTYGQAQGISQRLSDPPTPTSEQSSGANQNEEEEEGTNVPRSMEERSMLSKKLNTALRDLNAGVVDRNDPNSPLHPLKTFQELNLKSELLKGKCSIHQSQTNTTFAVQILSMIDRSLLSQVFIVWVFKLRVKFKPLLCQLY